MALFTRVNGAGKVLRLEPPRLRCTTMMFPPPSLKRDMKFIRASMPEFSKFDEANGPTFAAATAPLVDLLTETVMPKVREGNEGAAYHTPATLGFALGAFEKSRPGFTPGFTSTAWASWCYWLMTEVAAQITSTDDEALIVRGLAQWAVEAGRYLALADVPVEALRLGLFSQLAAELHKVFGPKVAVAHLHAVPGIPPQATEDGPQTASTDAPAKNDGLSAYATWLTGVTISAETLAATVTATANGLQVVAARGDRVDIDWSDLSEYRLSDERDAVVINTDAPWFFIFRLDVDAETTRAWETVLNDRSVTRGDWQGALNAEADSPG